jgi:Ca2+-binding RTX toxin-like protein
MRKATLVLGVVALVIALSATAAYAVVTIIGDADDNILTESDGDDIIFGKAGEDGINAFEFADDRDELRGGRGNDALDAQDGDGDDLLVGGGGTQDICEVNTDDEHRGCEIIQ